MHGHGGIVECLIIGVAKHECDIVDAFTIHVVDSIAAATTYTNHFDDAVFFSGAPKSRICMLFLFSSILSYQSKMHTY